MPDINSDELKDNKHVKLKYTNKDSETCSFYFDQENSTLIQTIGKKNQIKYNAYCLYKRDLYSDKTDKHTQHYYDKFTEFIVIFVDENRLN